VATGPISESRKSLFGQWILRYQQRRKRLKARSLSQVRFRFTREGYHLIFIVVFILTGAVLRDISLLTLIAAAMIGLLLLQWRFNVRTLTNLSIKRHLPIRTSVGTPVHCEISVSNRRLWLPSWLIAAEDVIKVVQPADPAKHKAGTIVNEIPARSTSAGVYSITFHHRGVFEVGPCKLSTRFPMGLGQSWRTLDIVNNITVHPKIGELTHEFQHLLQNSRNGQHQTASNVGYHEADFFGLRPWASGDSKRWIHWRTTARLGELSVRQFDRLEQQQSCLLLDLYQADSGKGLNPVGDIACERAVAFVATVVSKSGTIQGHKLAVGIAAKTSMAFPAVQGSVSANTMLDALAEVAPSDKPDLALALNKMTTVLVANPHLIVVSTRPACVEAVQATFRQLLGPRASTALQITWLEVAKGDLERYFLWTPSRSNDFVVS
jgi:uncharacterized protein (DUF58 family)